MSLILAPVRPILTGTPNATPILRLSVSAAHTGDVPDVVVSVYTSLLEMLAKARGA